MQVNIVREIYLKQQSFFKSAAEKGHARSEWIHGTALLYGLSLFSVDKEVGVALIKSSADKLFVEALETLAALYEKGKILLNQEKKYTESLAVFERIDPSYKDVEELISNIRSHLVELAEEHYRKGVKLFVNEELAKAIKEWEETLYLNPEHQKAKKDIQDATVLLEKLEEVD